ncbi:MAG: DUF503 domain-containing protein [Clostridiales bacterium]|nr:DUF503 domain-containing protein [Clostridiales bacterium]
MRMFIASAEIEILLYESQSLKEKRKVVKSLISKVRNQFNVAIAEINYLDTWQRAGLGLVCIANQSSNAIRQLDRVLEYIESDGRFEIINIYKELS